MDASKTGGAGTPGSVTSESENAGWQAGVEEHRAEGELLNCARQLETDSHSHAKTICTLRARLALAGWVLDESGRGGFVLSRWGRSFELNSLAELERHVCAMGGKP